VGLVGEKAHDASSPGCEDLRGDQYEALDEGLPGCVQLFREAGGCERCPILARVRAGAPRAEWWSDGPQPRETPR